MYKCTYYVNCIHRNPPFAFPFSRPVLDFGTLCDRAHRPSKTSANFNIAAGSATG